MENHPFVPGKNWVYYSRAIYGEREISAVIKTLRDDWLGVGEHTYEFEREISRLFGQKYGVFVNSGSSANWLAVRALQLPAAGEVITPACTFSTTVAPIVQMGLIPVFVDVELDTFNINPDLIEEAISPKTVALMIPHLIGNINDMARLRAIADKYSLKLIEDSCDTVGGSFQNEPTGKLADATTTSFYASHIITAMGGGGMVMFKDAELASRAQIMRDWGRVSAKYYDEHPDIRFDFFLDDIQYDRKFVFCEIGYNFKAIDAQAAFGLVQLSRLNEFMAIRKKNFRILCDFFGGYPEHFILPRSNPDADVCWLALPVSIRDTSRIKRMDFMKHLEKNKIQTRVLFAGNILRHPPYRNIPHRVSGSLVNSDRILARSILIGCHQGLRSEHLDYLMNIVKSYLSKV